MHRRLGIAVAIFAGFAIAQAATAPSANALAECRLEAMVAKAELEKLKVVKETDVSDLYSDDVTTEYDPAKIRPFGLQATRFAVQDYADEEIEFHDLQTDFSLPYDAAKTKLMKAFGITQCAGTAVTTTQACRLFLQETDGGKHPLMAELRQMTTGGSRLLCTYAD